MHRYIPPIRKIRCIFSCGHSKNSLDNTPIYHQHNTKQSRRLIERGKNESHFKYLQLTPSNYAIHKNSLKSCIINLINFVGGDKEINKRRLKIRDEPSDNITDTQNINREEVKVAVSVDLNINDQYINRSIARTTLTPDI